LHPSPKNTAIDGTQSTFVSQQPRRSQKGNLFNFPFSPDYFTQFDFPSELIFAWLILGTLTLNYFPPFGLFTASKRDELFHICLGHFRTWSQCLEILKNVPFFCQK